MSVRDKQRNTEFRARSSIEIDYGSNGEEEENEMAMAGTHSKNGCRTHTQKTVGMQIGRGQASSRRAEDAGGKHCHQGPEEMQD